MRVLLINDDGIHAGGIIALENHLLSEPDYEVWTVAPETEQSGISQAITFLRPLLPKQVYQGSRQRGFSVNGTPADCLKLALFDLAPWFPDIVISGINGGLNAGVNVLYSGTIGGALEAAFHGCVSFAVSLEFTEPINYEAAAPIAMRVIHKIVDQGAHTGCVYNINIPTAALNGDSEIVVVPKEINRMAFHFEQGTDPKGRKYFWATTEPGPPQSNCETDAMALQKGKITVTPIEFDMTDHTKLEELQRIFTQ